MRQVLWPWKGPGARSQRRVVAGLPASWSSAEEMTERSAQATLGYAVDHDPADMTPLLTFLSKISGTRYHQPSAADAHRRIAAFFTRHLTA